MKTIFMNTENSKTNEPPRFRLTLADKLNLKDVNKNMELANLSIYYMWRNIKSAYCIATINLKSLLQLGMVYLIYQTFKIILSTLLKTYHPRANLHQ